MSNEKQNNSWKDRLDQLEQLPGTTLAKDAAWDKLYDRLQEKPRRKKLAWYIPAAACLLLTCFVAWMITTNDKKKPSIATKIPAQQKQADTKKAAQPVLDIVSPTLISARQPEKKKATIESNHVIKTPGKLLYSIPVNIEQKETAVTISQPVVQDTVATTVMIAVAPKKKLKVVHLNEVGQPMQDEGRMAKSANSHSFKITFNNPDAFAQPTYNNTPSESRDQIKIKITPQN